MNKSSATAKSNLLSASRARRGSGLDITVITAESEKRFDRVGLFVQDRVEDIVGGAVARRCRRTERFLLAADTQRRRFFR